VIVYLALKTLHLVSVAVLFGTGLGIAYFMWRADRTRDVKVIAATARGVVLADILFTLPAVIAQPLTGYVLMRLAGWQFTEPWLTAAVALYAIAGACWLPVVWLQLRVRDLAIAALATNSPLPAAYRSYMRWWNSLGWPAFAAVLMIFALMVYKPG
jgi:uncharacterized membrane protein